jgi:hypothetical protein
MRIELTIAEGARRGRRFRFDAREVSIGRAPDSDLVLADAGVSRRHARIRSDGPGHMLLDEGSTNGTELNGAPVREAVPIRAGDRIGIGPLVLEFGRREMCLRRVQSEAVNLASRSGRHLATAARIVHEHCRARSLPFRMCIAVAIASCSCVALSFWLRHGRAAATTSARSSADAGSQPPPGAPPAPADVQAAREWYERGRHKLRERRVAPRNQYDAWSSFKTARRLLHDERPPPLDSVDALVEAAERDLASECSRLLFAARRFERYGQDDRAQSAYREILLHFPGDDPSGCRARARDNLEDEVERGAG